MYCKLGYEEYGALRNHASKADKGRLVRRAEVEDSVVSSTSRTRRDPMLYHFRSEGYY